MDPSALAGAESDAGADARVRAITKLTSLYDAGIPWFTKPALRELSRVLRTVRETGQSAELLLQSLEQGDVIPMQRLRIMPYDEDGDHDQRPFEFNGRELVVRGRPVIGYETISHMVGSLFILDGYSEGYTQSFYPFAIFAAARGMAREPTVSLNEARQRFSEARGRWEGGAVDQAGTDAARTLEGLRKLLAEWADRIPPGVDKIIGFGLGTFSRLQPAACDDDDEEEEEERERGDTWRLRTATQHLLLLELRRFFEARRDGGGVKCYVQDPAYTAEDRQVLAEEGIEVLEDPDGFILVDGTSVVVSVAADVPVRQVVADIAAPAMMVWEEVVQWDPAGTAGENIPKGDELAARFSPGWTDPPAPRLFEMVDDYHRVGFPEDPANFGCSTTMYVRKDTWKRARWLDGVYGVAVDETDSSREDVCV